MPQDIDILPAPVGGRKPPLIPTLVVGGAFFVGLVVMMVLNRTEIGLIVSQFGMLWSVEKNRKIIIALLFRMILTAVVFAAVALAGCLAVYVLKHYQQDEEETLPQKGTRPQPPQQESIDQKRRGTIAVPVGERRREPVAAVRQPHVASYTPQVTRTAPPQVIRSEIQLPMIPSVPLFPAQTMMMSTSDIREQDSHDQVGTVQGDKVLVPEALLEEHTEQSKVSEVAPTTQQTEHKEEDGPVYIEIHLLKTVRMNLYVPRLCKRYPIKVDDLYSKARHLIAYIAWQQGKMVKLDDMRTHIFGAGEADTDQVHNAFSTAKRDIRRRIDQAVEQANDEAGEQVLPDNLDIFVLAKNRKYFLPEYCRVIDLAFIEQQQHIIEQAENTNQLVNIVPQAVKNACDALIKAYKGDFIEDLLAEDPDAIDPWVQSWAREPFTWYRDYYLQALLYAGEHERKTGDEADASAQKREHYANAARLFVQGAMAACNKRVCDGRFDTKVFFAKTGRRAGHHVTLGEQLIRRGVAYYGKIGSTTLANRAYGAYEQQMLLVSGRAWSAHPETSKILDSALKQTGAYQFPDTIATPYDHDEALVSVESA